MRNIVTEVSVPSRVVSSNFSVDERGIEGKIIRLNFQDEVKIEKYKRELTIYVTRTAKDETGSVNLSVSSCGQRILLDESISIDELKAFFKSHYQVLDKEAKQNSIYITQFTLLTGFGGIISPPRLNQDFELVIHEQGK